MRLWPRPRPRSWSPSWRRHPLGCPPLEAGAAGQAFGRHRQGLHAGRGGHPARPAAPLCGHAARGSGPGRRPRPAHLARGSRGPLRPAALFADTQFEDDEAIPHDQQRLLGFGLHHGSGMLQEVYFADIPRDSSALAAGPLQLRRQKKRRKLRSHTHARARSPGWHPARNRAGGAIARRPARNRAGGARQRPLALAGHVLACLWLRHLLPRMWSRESRFGRTRPTSWAGQASSSRPLPSPRRWLW